MIIALEGRTGQLADHGKLFQVIFEQAAVGVALVSTSNGKFLKINKKYCDIVGYSEEEMLNKDFQSITCPEDVKSDLEIIGLLKSGKIREFSREKRYIRKNGDIVWVNATVSPMWDPGKQPSYHITVVQDVTERKRAEQKLIESENELVTSRAMLIKAEEIGNMGAWELDLDTNDLTWSKEVYNIYGLDPRSGKPKYEFVINTLAPESKNDFLKAIDDALKWRKPFDIDFIIIRPDRTRTYAYTKGEVIFDREGHPIKMFGMVQDITMRKQVEEKLKNVTLKARSEKNKSDAIISALGDGIIIQDKNYKIIYQNNIQSEIYGEHNGELCYKVYEGRDTICEDCPVEKTFKDGKIHRSERTYLIGGRISYFDLISSPLRDTEGNIIAGIKIVRDITEKRQAEEEVRATKDRLQFLLSSSPAVIYTCNAFGDFGYTYISENVTKLLGYKSSDFTENPSFWQDRIHPDDKGMVLKNLENIFESGQQINEYRFLDNGGVYRWMRDELKLIWDEHGKPKEIAGYWIDITKSKQAQEERTQLLEKEYAARTDAEAARKLDRMKNMFIASTSHELRTPLNSIIGFTGILLQGWSGEINKEQKEYLEMINSSSKHLLELIIDILDISKIESGRIDLQVSGFDLRGVVDEVISTLNANIKEKRLVVSIEMEDIYMKTDRTRLLQCILNLVGNAAKYTEKGSIKIKAKIIKNNVHISVIDTGIGIKTEDIPKLFAPFARLESPLTLKTSGTGLGLYLTKKLACDVLGGEIDVKSEYGKGSTFTMQVPVEIEKRAG